MKVALVPPDVTRTVASTTLLVARTPDPGTGLAHFLWYYLTSTPGRSAIAARFERNIIALSLSKSAGRGTGAPAASREVAPASGPDRSDGGLENGSHGKRCVFGTIVCETQSSPRSPSLPAEGRADAAEHTRA